MQAKPKKSHSASLTLKSAIWEYCWEARWSIFICSLIFFLAAQTSRQVPGLCMAFLFWVRLNADGVCAHLSHLTPPHP